MVRRIKSHVPASEKLRYRSKCVQAMIKSFSLCRNICLIIFYQRFYSLLWSYLLLGLHCQNHHPGGAIKLSRVRDKVLHHGHAYNVLRKFALHTTRQKPAKKTRHGRRMRIKKILLSGFKSYKSQEKFDDFHPCTNVLGVFCVPQLWRNTVGKNGSGKSNLIFGMCALRCVSWSCTAIRFLLSNEFKSLRSEERKALLHVWLPLLYWLHRSKVKMVLFLAMLKSTLTTRTSAFL